MPVLPHDRYATLAELLKDQHRRLKEEDNPVTHAEIASQTLSDDGEPITDAYVGILQRGRADTAVAKWGGAQAYSFLAAYRLTTQEIKEVAQRFKLRNVLDYLQLRQAGTPHRVKGGGPSVRLMGTVSAGRFGDAFADDELMHVDIPAHVLKHHDPSDVFALDVSGDSMLCDDAARSIPQGTRVYFHSRLRPNVGQVVCVRLEQEDISVIKLYRPGSNFVTLMSHNKAHRPIVIDENTPAKIEGVKIGLSAAD